MFISSPRDLNSYFREEALHLGKSPEVTREQYAKGDASARCGERSESLQQSLINFHFHPGNHRKSQSLKTVTGNKKYVSRLSVTCIGQEPVTLAFQEQNITVTITKTRLPKEYNWSGHSDLDRSL